jgi:hypothetical protein
VLVLVGCSADRSGAGKAGLPAAGNVRIVATPIKEDTKHFSWLWTIIGERNWTRASASSTGLKLSGTYPMNSKDRVGGTHIWEARITIEPAGRTTARATYLMHCQLRGSNAAMADSTITLEVDANSTLTSVARAIQRTETTAGLPATISLASVGRRNINLEIER